MGLLLSRTTSSHENHVQAAHLNGGRMRELKCPFSCCAKFNSWEILLVGPNFFTAILTIPAIQ